MGSPATTALVGRAGELEAITRLLDREDDAVAALVLEGDPGVGKTSLWEHGVAAARERGQRVLVTRASDAETALPFAGLIDLLDTVASDELGTVPAPQRRALEVALYRAEPTGAAPEPQVISLAVLSALRALAAQGPVLIALDDIQWLDRASEDALGYAVRRLRLEPVTLLLAKRPVARTALERSLPDERTERVVVGAASLGATRQILASRLGLRLPHHVLRRVFDTTMGNPLFALEVGRMLAEHDPDTLGGDLPVPDHVDDLLGLRVADLDLAAGRVLLALALDPDLRVAQLVELAGPAALDGAVDAGVVAVDGERVRAAHPLLAAVAKRNASDGARRDMHERVAELVVDEPRRALHLALATLVPDEELAERIATAADLAAARGAIRLAADLAAHALRLTPADRSDADRLLALGRYLHHAGEKERLTELLSGRVQSLPAGAPRVTAYLLLINGVVRGNEDIVTLLESALAKAGEDPLLRARCSVTWRRTRR